MKGVVCSMETPGLKQSRCGIIEFNWYILMSKKSDMFSLLLVAVPVYCGILHQSQIRPDNQ